MRFDQSGLKARKKTAQGKRGAASAALGKGTKISTALKGQHRPEPESMEHRKQSNGWNTFFEHWGLPLSTVALAALAALAAIVAKVLMFYIH